MRKMGLFGRTRAPYTAPYGESRIESPPAWPATRVSTLILLASMALGGVSTKAQPPEIVHLLDDTGAQNTTLALPNQRLVQSFRDMGLTSSEVTHYLQHFAPPTDSTTRQKSSQIIDQRTDIKPDTPPDSPTNSDHASAQPAQEMPSFVDTLQYLRAGAGPEFFEDTRLPAAFESFKQHPREWMNFILGGAIGGSAANAWATVFSADPNVSYFLYPPHTGYISTNSIAWPVLGLVLLPEIIANVDVMGRIKTQSPLAQACEMPPSTTFTTLTWTNRVVTTLFLAKFFKIYYGATWGNRTPSGAVAANDSDYWFLITYMWSNWWKKYDILGHKIHLLTHDKIPDAGGIRHKTESRLSAAYRKLQQGSDTQVLAFAAFVKQLDRNAITEAEKQQAMLAILSYLYDFVDQEGVNKEGINPNDPEAATKNFGPFFPKPKPQSLKVLERGGQIFATAVVPFAVLGAYFAWDSVLELTGARNETFHFEDKDMKEPDSWAYAIIAAAYAGGSGWTSGDVWARHLWCRWTGQDPNQYREHLEYWPQNFQGLRAIMGGGTTYLLSSLLMFPIAGLATEQMFVLGWSMASQKAVLATIAQWGVIIDTAFTEPRYQELITKIGNLSGGDPIGTIKDDTLRMIVELQEGIGKLKPDKLEALHKSLEELTEIRATNMEKFRAEERNVAESYRRESGTVESDTTEPYAAKEDATEDGVTGQDYLLVSSTSPPGSLQEMQTVVQGRAEEAVYEDTTPVDPLLEQLLPHQMPSVDRVHPAPSAPGVFSRARKWLWGGGTISPDLQDLVNQVRS